MIRAAVFLFAGLFAAAPLWAAGGGALMKYRADLSDQRSLQRGAAMFVNYCQGCHSAAFMRYNRLGADLGIPEDVLKANFMFGTDKPGDTMITAMNPADAEQWFGVAPPDLSVMARARGADWLYSYFMTFYRDRGRNIGANNLQFQDAGMPHVLWELQGWQRPVYADMPEGGGRALVERLEPETLGKLTEAQYAAAVGDLVNFLVYLAEPARLKRYTIGFWVMIYLLILLAVVYLLKKEYWKDVR
jgi:ubiquinol-cytochrome c reductase cytochrome c1 subunit